jgi:hypothetical protein
MLGKQAQCMISRNNWRWPLLGAANVNKAKKSLLASGMIQKRQISKAVAMDRKRPEAPHAATT